MTPLLDVQNISKAFGAHVLFENISFSIAEGQHVGLIAKNGTGKSTLLSLLSGKESVDSGSIIFRRDIKVGFLEQQPKFDPEESVLDACFNHQGDPDRILKAKQILTQLHITDLTQPMGQLSGGQQKRIALANVLITEPDLLILDEPTNHLDLEMIEWADPGNKRQIKANSSYYLLKKTKIPIVIVECGFLSNRTEAEALCSDEYQDCIAWEITLGILQYLNAQ